MHGKVHVWKMTEEERLAYIEKYPIKPTPQSSGATFVSVLEAPSARTVDNRMRSKTMKKMQSVDTEELHKLFLSGEKLSVIAKTFGLTETTLNYYIKEQRKIEPEKWPHRREKAK